MPSGRHRLKRPDPDTSSVESGAETVTGSSKTSESAADAILMRVRLCVTVRDEPETKFAPTLVTDGTANGDTPEATQSRAPFLSVSSGAKCAASTAGCVTSVRLPYSIFPA